MLKQFSRLERTRSLVIIVFASLMGLSLIFFYAPRRDAVTMKTTSKEVAASVGGEDITVGDVARRRDQFMNQMQMYGQQVNPAMLGGSKRFLEELIPTRIMVQEAARLGLAPSDREVALEIQQNYTDPSTGKFIGTDKYKERVASQFGSELEYERLVRDSLAARKLRAYLTAGVQVSDQEVQDEFRRKNTSFDLVYVTVSADLLAKKLNPSDEELQKYFDEHKDDFKFNEPQKKIRYVYIDQEKVGQKLKIEDKDLREEFDKLAPEAKQKGVRVQQIVFKVARPDLDQEVLTKATELLGRIRDEQGNSSEEKFAEAARGNSEDPATAKSGGWLPDLVRKDPKHPEAILQSTLNMRPGQIGEPVKTGNSYYIFRRGDSVEKTFEEAKNDLSVSLRNRQSYRVAAEIASRAAAQLKESKDPQKVAEALASEANMTPAEMVRETPFIKPGDDVPNIGSAPQFEEAIAPLEKPQDVGDRVSVKGGFAIPMLAERRDPRVPEFAEVKERVADRVKQERAESQLEQTAREIASSANSPDDLKSAAEKYGLKAEPLPSYRAGTPTPAGTSPEVDAAIANLKAGEVAKTPVKTGATWTVVGVSKRTDADMAEFAKQREQLTTQALESRRTQVFTDYVASTRTRYDREGKIKIYDEVVAQLDAEEEPAAQPPAAPRGLPPVVPVKQ